MAFNVLGLDSAMYNTFTFMYLNQTYHHRACWMKGKPPIELRTKENKNDTEQL